MDKPPISPALKCLAAVAFLFLLAPVLIVVPLSFSGDVFMSFPPKSWSGRWYAAILQNPKMLEAFLFSVKLAAGVTVVNLAIAVPASYALVRLAPRGAEAMTSLFTAPLLLPTIVLGLAMLIIFARIGLLATVPGLFVAHLVVTLPYVLRVISTALSTLPIAVEEAAATLGAAPATVFRRVTLPMMLPGLVAAGALSFLVSFDEVVLSLFMSGPRLSTLPVEMYHHVESRADPLVAAISVLLVVFTLAIVIVVDRSLGLAKTFVK
ncbi:ABC transporter permease [Prosthecomicrobium hirschii]|uniref:ABC transporter permease n=1 Tax=Prosthecodimorpha hirschii TaxID=665126 RepID=UPI002220B5AF|nr:ABC transporter permease [Prosthecomicrobium hirschii]MCW1842602.1 ABC transporter permease [Prosthecomicrobium hirschii]